MDPSWYPLNLEGRENNLTAFSTDLLLEIAKLEKLSLTKNTLSWDALLDSLQKGQCDAILFSMQPHPFLEANYSFSPLYLQTGPVLVVPIDSPIHALGGLSGKELAVQPDFADSPLFNPYPDILVRTYSSIPEALNALAEGSVDGALIDTLLASPYVHDLYKSTLKIITPPLTQEGLRLISLKNHSPELMKKFEQGLTKLQQSGRYQELLTKWNLPSST